MDVLERAAARKCIAEFCIARQTRVAAKPRTDEHPVPIWPQRRDAADQSQIYLQVDRAHVTNARMRNALEVFGTGLGARGDEALGFGAVREDVRLLRTI